MQVQGVPDNKGLGAVMTSIVALEAAREEREVTLTESDLRRAELRIEVQEKKLKDLQGKLAWDW